MKSKFKMMQRKIVRTKMAKPNKVKEKCENKNDKIKK